MDSEAATMTCNANNCDICQEKGIRCSVLEPDPSDKVKVEPLSDYYLDLCFKEKVAVAT